MVSGPGGYQEIHVSRLDRFPASYRTEYTHTTQAAPGRGRENLPPSRPKGPEIRRPFLLRWTWHNARDHQADKPET